MSGLLLLLRRILLEMGCISVPAAPSAGEVPVVSMRMVVLLLRLMLMMHGRDQHGCVHAPGGVAHGGNWPIAYIGANEVGHARSVNRYVLRKLLRIG